MGQKQTLNRRLRFVEPVSRECDVQIYCSVMGGSRLFVKYLSYLSSPHPILT